MSDSNVPGLAKTGAVAGLAMGLALQGGIFCLMSGFACFLLGNAISGLQRGEIKSFIRQRGLFYDSNLHNLCYSRKEEPMNFWLGIIMEFTVGILLLVAFFHNYKDAYPAGPA